MVWRKLHSMLFAKPHNMNSSLQVIYKILIIEYLNVISVHYLREWGKLPWWQLLRLISRCPTKVTATHLEDQAPVDLQAILPDLQVCCRDLTHWPLRVVVVILEV